MATLHDVERDSVEMDAGTAWHTCILPYNSCLAPLVTLVTGIAGSSAVSGVSCSQAESPMGMGLLLDERIGNQAFFFRRATLNFAIRPAALATLVKISTAIYPANCEQSIA